MNNLAHQMSAMEMKLIQVIDQPEKILVEISKLESSPNYLDPNTLKALQDVIDQHRYQDKKILYKDCISVRAELNRF